MFKIILIALILCSSRAGADDKSQVSDYHAPVTVSVFGPVSTNFENYEWAHNYFCVGFINCSARNLSGFSAALGYNVTTKDMKGLSAAMISNYTGGDSYGIHLSFLGNFIGGSFLGVQGSFVNITRGQEATGLQFGLINYTRAHTIGLQLGPANIVTGEVLLGWQFGFLNYDHGSLYGWQLSPLNIVIGPELRGTQTGFFNYNQGALYGLQLSFLNIVLGETMQGMQAGILNYDHGSNKGVQVGFINIVSENSLEPPPSVQIGIINVSNQSKAVPLGLINIARGGRLSFNLSRDALQMNRLTLHMGSRNLYAIHQLHPKKTNPGKLFHPDTSELIFQGFGASVGVAASENLNIEWLETSPSNYLRDHERVLRILWEHKLTPFSESQIGMEFHNFEKPSEERSIPYQFRGKNRVYGLTAGISLNTIAYWQ